MSGPAVGSVGVGLTSIDGEVRGPGGEEPVRFLVDSGATYTLLPAEVWQRLELQPTRTLTFGLPDGSSLQRGVSECEISLAQGRAHTPVILGEADDEALLGVVTLEVLGLVLNPFSRRLQPMRMLLA